MTASGFPKTLLFIRHAETDLAGTFCGSSNPPLNERGRRQLETLLETCASQPLDAVYSSDLERAMSTAAALADTRAIKLVTRPALREIDFGQWETLTWQRIEQRDAPFAARWVAEFPALPAPGGELITSFRHRILAEIAWLRAVREQHIAVVTHAGPLRVLLEEFGHLAPQHAWERTRDYTCSLRCTQRTAEGTLDVHV